MNPRLAKLQPYPFERVRALIGGMPDPKRTIDLSIGEPKHPTPQFIKDALVAALDGLSTYPRSVGLPELRKAISDWLARRYGAGFDFLNQFGGVYYLFLRGMTGHDPAAGIFVHRPTAADLRLDWTLGET